MAESLGKHTRRKFWGWGNADIRLTEAENARINQTVSLLAPANSGTISAPQLDEYNLRPPRMDKPRNLSGILSDTPYDRIFHAYGQSCADILRLLMREAPNAPDFVAFPKCENNLVEILEWCMRDNLAAIPFGGGTSVCGGVEPDVGMSYNGAVSLDLQYLDKVLEIDPVSRAAHIQGGMFGPDIEDALRPHGLSLRHFPQSFAFSTLGGWIATRAGGHYATLYTHIDDLVEAVSMITPSGHLASRRLPGSGAGISADRMMLGSEGTLGIITDSWVRLQDRPDHRTSTSIRFPDFFAAARAVRAISQAALFPANCRVLDEREALQNGVGDGTCAILLLGFESADHEMSAPMARALELAVTHGGIYESTAKKTRDRATGEWRNAFIRMPYYRDEFLRRGVLFDTFETAITWNKFEDFHKGVMHHMQKVIKQVTGRPAFLSCRFTHIYPDGPAPYYTFGARGGEASDPASALVRWREIKSAANEVVTSLGGTVTHHHAVGRDHRSGYEKQTSPLFRQALQGLKRRLDPSGILNPGILIDPLERPVGIRGALKNPTT